MAIICKYKTFINTPEYEEDLYEIISENDCGVDSYISTECTLIIDNNIINEKQQKKNKDSILLFNVNHIELLKSSYLLFSDTSNCCYTEFYHYTLKNFIYEHMHIIGLLLNTTKQWIIETINYNINLKKNKDNFIYNTIKLKYKTLYSLMMINIKNEIIEKKITNLKKPNSWTICKFIKFIRGYFNKSKIIKINKNYYIIQNKNKYIDGKIIINNNIIISCDFNIISDIYCSILNNIKFTGFDALYYCVLNKKNNKIILNNV